VIPGSVVLLWMPVGAGGRLVARTSGWWERACARRAHRSPRPLFHAALEVFLPDARYVVEMAPAWGVPAPERGVVATGPVGRVALGRSRLLRYEVRCWRDGVLPDRGWAVGPPLVLLVGGDRAGRVRHAVSRVPRFTWGADPFGVGDPWTSNSIVSWLLAGAGVDAGALAPPDGGAAPGWRSGILAANEREPVNT
jgi:hypothetical protein